ncbi:MAG: bifunctional L-myo-inositol-1-phosphate cytidylyltransferase/CDP-L-myo-inositol myo-inositolphosphotransferase [Anaerolineae bacterium]
MRESKRNRALNHDLPVVILAAGEGSRLQGRYRGVPKPLVPVLGLTLLERAILACREAGICEFYVVTGYGRDKVRAHIDVIRQRYGLSIQVIENPDWAEGNGVSVLAAAPYLRDREAFLLVMCDHLFDPEILRRLIEARDGSDRCLLAIDRRTRDVFDLDDATKVNVDGDGIIAIGKELTQFNAVDTGCFLLRPVAFDALAAARAKGEGTVTAGVRELIAMGKMGVVDIGDALWIDVDTPASLVEAERRLLAQLGKPRGDGPISRWLNRPLSRRISGLLARTGITPNGISVAGFLLSVLGALLLSRGEGAGVALGGLVVQLASVIDGCDGEIARLKHQSSAFGAWFDTVLDRYADALIVAGTCYGYWRTHPAPTVWLAGIMAMAGFIMFSYTKKEFQVRYGREMPGQGSYEWVPASRDVRLFMIFAGALMGHPFEAAVIAGLLAHLSVVLRFLSMYRRGHLQAGASVAS